MEYKQSLGKLKAIGIVGIMQQPSVDIGCHKHQTDGYIFRDVNHVSRVIDVTKYIPVCLGASTWSPTADNCADI